MEKKGFLLFIGGGLNLNEPLMLIRVPTETGKPEKNNEIATGNSLNLGGKTKKDHEILPRCFLPILRN